MAGLNFNAATVEPSAPLSPIPPGEYSVTIVESEIKPTRQGDGSYLSLTMQVFDGEYKNRKLWTNLNLSNPNPTAVEIAQKDLSAICHAVGVIQLTDSIQLHDKPMTVVVGITPASGQYEASNKIKGYKAYGAGTVAPGAMMAPPPPPPPPAPSVMAPPPAPFQPAYHPSQGVAPAPFAGVPATPAPMPAVAYQQAPPVQQAPPPQTFTMPAAQPAGQFVPPAPPFQPAPEQSPQAAPVQQVPSAPPTATPPWAQAPQG